MNVSMESSIDEDEGLEKVEKEALDTTTYQPDFVTEVNKKPLSTICYVFTPAMSQG